MREVKCANNGCKWNRRGKCVLFAGQSLLECKYRAVPQKTQKAGKAGKTSKPAKTKGTR